MKNIKYEKEITVLVLSSLESLVNILEKLNFELIKEYEMNDIYMVDKRVDLSTTSSLDILKNCILVRNVSNKKLELLYKRKKYDNLENIIEESKIICPISDVEKAIDFMEAINYEKLITVNNKSKIYKKSDLEIAVQYINEKFVTIEVERENGEDIEDLIKKINNSNIPFDKSSYFVKKAEIVLMEKLK